MSKSLSPKTVALVVAITTVVGLASPVRSEESADPWFPLVEEKDSPLQVYDSFALSVVRSGEKAWRVNRGKYRESVSRHDFFLTVGRPDLAASESFSTGLSSLLAWGGGASIGIGIFLLYAHLSPGGLEPSATPGLVLLGGGLICMNASNFITGPRLSGDEVESMVLRYNVQLRKHIYEGVGQRDPGSVEASLRTRVVPWLAPNGAGLSLLAAY